MSRGPTADVFHIELHTLTQSFTQKTEKCCHKAPPVLFTPKMTVNSVEKKKQDLVILFIIFVRVNIVLEKVVSSGHGDLLLFFGGELLEAKEQESLEILGLLLNGLSHTDIDGLGSGFFGKLHDVDELRFIEKLHGGLFSDLDEEFLGLMFDKASEITMRVLFGSFGKENLGTDLIGDELLVVKGELGKENFIFGGSFNYGHHFWWLGSGTAFSSVGNAKSRAGR